MSSTALCGPFKDGSHFRTSGMRAFLVGVKSTTRIKDAEIDLTLHTTGIYQDIADDGVVWAFTTKERAAPFSYVTTDKSQEAIGIDSVQVQKNIKHMNPAPLILWTIKPTNPSESDLSGLSDVRLECSGSACCMTR